MHIYDTSTGNASALHVKVTQRYTGAAAMCIAENAKLPVSSYSSGLTISGCVAALASPAITVNCMNDRST